MAVTEVFWVNGEAKRVIVFSGTLCKRYLGRYLMCCIRHASLQSSAAVQKGHVHVGEGGVKLQDHIIN